MAGIYIHIPFCKKKCHYCNFFSTPSNKFREAFVPSVIKEIELQKAYLDEEVNTIYFGGGTPSLLSGEELNNIFDSIQRNFQIGDTPEITMEVNPDDISAAKIKEIRNTPVTRISIGVQSFYAMDLKYLNRVHEEGQGEYAIKSLQDAGYDNLSIDLIFGAPSLGMGHWKENLNKTIEFSVPHISAYALTVEPNTNLEVLISKRKLAAVSEAETINQFKYLMSFLKEQGFIHYEISNFCLPGFTSIHNSSYWDGPPYLGVGPSAHSFDRTSRQWNCSHLDQYIGSIEQNSLPFEREVLTPDQKYNEYIMTSLRTAKGLNAEFVEKEFGENYADHMMASLHKYDSGDWIETLNNNICLTDEGKLFSDLISSELFINV
ncbi:MAG: radical SAM family heme chaperone HemW [Bacteroidota bacterium]